MNADEIDRLLMSKKSTQSSFIGVYSCDNLPSITPKTFSLVVNTDPQGKPGAHWQVIHVKNSKAFFFCSLGYKMNSPVKLFLKRFKAVETNRHSPQHADEVTCGGYCIFVITMLSEGHKFQDICSFFDVIPHDDKVVREFLKYYFNYTIQKK